MTEHVSDENRLRRRQWWFWPLVALALLVGAAVVCEFIGWPFLAGPVERGLSKTLQRQFTLNDSSASGRATVRFFRHLEVKVPALRIASPDWSQQPFFIDARNATLRLTYSAIWRAKNGEPLDIELLRAEKLDVHAERMKDGRASWAFGDPRAPKSKQPMQMPTVHELRVDQGTMTYLDEPFRVDVTAKLRLAEGEATQPEPQTLPRAVQGLIASAEGTYGGAALKANLRTSGATPLLASGVDANAVPVKLELRSGKSALDFDGTVTDVLKMNGMSGAFKVSGPSLAEAGEPLGVTLPSTGAFVLRGTIKKDGGLWNFVASQATVGSSQLKAALTFDTRPAVPLLSGQVSGSKLLLADLAPTIAGDPEGAAAPPPSASAPKAARVLPDKEFDLPSLRAMNANVLMSFDRVELGSIFALPLEPLKTHLKLRDGKLRLDDIVARTADGSVSGSLGLDGTGDIALWDANLRWGGVKLEKWIAQKRDGDKPPFIAGNLLGRATLKGQGKSTAQILGSLDGSVVTTLRNGKLSHLIVEGAGIDIAQAIGVLIKGDESLPVNCAVADMKAEKGVLRPRALVIETPDSNVWADGQISLVSETLDMKAVVSPKDFSPLALRTPIHVKGQFNALAISLEKAPLARKAGLAVLLAFINPLAAVIPLVDLGDGEKADNCQQMLERARHSAGISATATTASR